MFNKPDSGTVVGNDVSSTLLSRKKNDSRNHEIKISRFVLPWTNFGQQDETWAEFSTPGVAACTSYAHVAVEQNVLT